ncbi:MAG: glycoside hydrolase family 88 protein [Chloroflexota bacterium]|nr:glycoside hydrolase family 88 protein [Chloroflexia bacterium]MDQ3225581.1 glycoside hydrolase family 88 protein [Chloroflexota bacterium]
MAEFDPSASLEIRAAQALEFGQTQVRGLITQSPDFFPLYTEEGKWQHGRAAWTNWCEGFLGGMMWIFARRGEDVYWRERAEHYSRLIEDRQHDTEVHDLGFVFWSTWKRWFNLTGDEAIQARVIQAGRTMGQRFNDKGKFLRSFVAADSCFIDIMMNVGIVFYAANETGDEDLLRKAREHCLTTRKFLVRGDGSTAHEGIFDLQSGEFLRQTTHQGWRSDSSWARGLTWALYGFGTAYHLSGDERFLDTAEQCADFFIARSPSHGVPPNDWDEPSPRLPVESSAAAIAASGLLQLASLTGDQTRKTMYDTYARTILDTLLTTEFLAVDTPEWEGILKHGSYHERLDLGVDESVMWGEYFFVEALDKLLGAPAAS